MKTRVDRHPTFRAFAWRVVTAHVLTYFVVGLLAFTVLDYREVFADTDLRFLMRSTDSAIVALGPSLQIVRGLLFACVMWPFVGRVLSPGGALALWGLLVGLAVFGAAGPSPGSLEGLIYTTIPIDVQLIGLPEVIIQTGLFAFIIVWWCRHPARWKNVVAGIGLALVVAVGVLGNLAS